MDIGTVLIVAWAVAHTIAMAIFSTLVALAVLFMTVAYFPVSLIFWYIVLNLSGGCGQ